MSNNRNYNHNRHDHISNNHQQTTGVHGGEYRRGRKSQYKNNNPMGGNVPNEYIDANKEE